MSVQNRTSSIDRAADERIAVLVLGMHRSGTSALTRVLSLVGCDLPKTLMPEGEGNEAGHWESDVLYGLNEAILESAGSNWQEWQPVYPDWYQSAKRFEFKQRAIELVEREFGQSRLFVFKDPRNSLLLPFWFDVLSECGIRPVCVLSVRNPEEVAASLERRDGLEPAFGTLIWLRHMLEAEHVSRGQVRSFVSYGQLLQDWPSVIDRLKKELGLTWPRDARVAGEAIDKFLQRDLRHFDRATERTLNNPLLSPWVKESYEIFEQWAKEGQTAQGSARLDELRKSFDASTATYAQLIRSGVRAIARSTHQAAELEATRSSLAALQEEVSVLGVREAGATDTSDALRQQLAQLEQALVVRESELETTRSSLATLNEEIGVLGAREAGAMQTSDALRQQLALLDQDLIARDAELVRLRESEIQERRAIEEREKELASGRREISLLESKLEASLLTERLVREELAQASSALSQRRAELADMHEQLEADRIQSRRIERQLRSELEDAADLVATLRRSIAQGETRLEIHEAKLAELTAENGALRAAALELQASMTANEESFARQQAEAESNIAERFNEIAMLSRRLQTAEDAAQQQYRNADRLREITAVLWRAGRFRAWLPSKFLKRRQLAILKARRLFDGEAYLRIYPDVAADNVDPLRHYIAHGAMEGRSTGTDDD